MRRDLANYCCRGKRARPLRPPAQAKEGPNCERQGDEEDCQDRNAQQQGGDPLV